MLMNPTRRQLLIGAAASAAYGQKELREKAPERKHLLIKLIPPPFVAEALLPATKWRPFPPAADRAGWEQIPAAFRPALVETAVVRIGSEWPVLPASLFLEYKRNGNRTRYQDPYFARREHLRDLVLAECIEFRGRFVDGIADAVWSICEESFWGVPAHLAEQRTGVGLPDIEDPIIDLFAAETSAMLAWIWYLLGPELDKASPRIGERIHCEAERRILKPARERIDLHWMGLDPSDDTAMNNHTPWTNSNWLTTALLLEPDQQRRVGVVVKSLASLDRFLDVYKDDGGCDEGPGYWSEAAGALMDCLETLHSASGGRIDVFDMPLLRELGRYILRAHVAGDFFINFADAAPRVRPPADVVYRYGKRIGDKDLQAMGGWLFHRGSGSVPLTRNMGRQLQQLFHYDDLAHAPVKEPLLRDVWLPGIQVMTARRREGSTDGLYVAAQGGNNGESHNHNDVGNFIVYADGKPVIIDIGVENYTSKTFSSRRYEIWTMQSAWHNLPTIGGVMQGGGPGYRATGVQYRAGDEAAEFSLNLASAYLPEAGIRSWLRTIRLDRRADELTIEDRSELAAADKEVFFTLMAAYRPDFRGAGALTVGPLGLLYDSTLQPVIEDVALTDSKLRASWGDRLWRIRLAGRMTGAKGAWSIRLHKT